MPQISIIMPLYNAEKYLEESLESVLSQTFTNYELICINDASTDTTLEILERYQNMDSRIKVLINTERRGAAYSRNKGIQKAVGKYISFLDGDDIFEEEMLFVSFRKAEEKNADIVMFDYKHEVSEKIREKKKVYHSPQYIKKYCKDTFSVREQEPYDWSRWSGGPCNKLFKLSFIQDNGLKFQTLSSSNDVYFVCAALLLSKNTIVLEDNRVMVYARDHNLPTRISYQRDPMCAYQAIVHLQEMLLARDLFSELYEHFFYWAFFVLRATLERLKSEESKKEFYLFLKEQGIDNLIKEGTYYNKLDKDVKLWYQEFREKDIESKWFENRTPLYFYLRDKENLIKEIFDKYKKENKKVAVWGAGRNGVTFLEFCNKNQLHIDVVLDSNKKKQGTHLLGCPIHSFEEVSDNVNVILVTAQNIFDYVKDITNGKKIELIDINVIMDC